MYYSLKDVSQFLILAYTLSTVQAQDALNEVSFVEAFRKCKMGTPQFDNCIRDAINSVRPFFKTGVPELNLPPFDPFFAKEVIQVRGGDGLNYRLTLKNVTESGWTASTVTSFKSDPKQQIVRYTQFFPEKYLNGAYEFQGRLMSSQMFNKGFWNLTLYDLVQTTTISRLPKSQKLKVYIEVLTINDLELHVSNLLRGRLTFANSMLDAIINRTWRPFFRMIRPLINDLVTTAFTEIFNNAFANFSIAKLLGSQEEN